MPWTSFVLSLLTWRLTSLLVYEDGPWRIFSGLRYRMGVREETNASRTELDRWLAANPGEVVPEHFALNFAGEILLCFFCSSLWVAFGVVELAILFGGLTSIEILYLPFAVSAAAIVLDRWIHGQS